MRSSKKVSKNSKILLSSDSLQTNTDQETCQPDLSILDLQTLRRDSKVKNYAGYKSNIRPPQQDVFRVHKPGFHISTERVWFPRTTEDEVRNSSIIEILLLIILHVF